ncbi:PREDICTED: E3 ISG15--protein ligase HERC5 isoform X2 [Cercocebus atys]|uniref:E3 ISG15--protein ligase HERC5 isoform X2 n=1 Tax=Cercocebus atys TaxID=9531 RepID=UPI0005F43B64|nr:PREDICTED: E3 ISG15--protein ligase HERC5 isoform X2 [Cercocebus atys]
MERRSRRKSRRGGRSTAGQTAASQPAKSPDAQLWLFPSAAGFYRGLLRRAEVTRQVCCSPRRLAVLERGGAGVQVHQVLAGSGGARTPKCIKLGKNMKIHSVDQGADHMLILSSDGKPFEYDYSMKHLRSESILQEKKIIQITCGDYHSLALSKGGELFAWGQNLHGQLGVGRKFPSTTTPQIVEHLAGVPLAQISAGEAHSMALSMSGNIYSWGKNEFGQLGLGHTENKDSPSLIEALDNQKVEFLACGGSHSALLTQDGLLFTFGAGKHGQLGHNSTQNELRPCLVAELVGNRVTQIACGRWHTLAYVSDLGKVFSFGSGKDGQLGNGGTLDQLIPLPVKVSSSEELKLESHTSEKELIMIAGGNQSILLWIKKENSYVNLKRTIPTLNEGTVKRWIADVETKRWHSTKREIQEIFSSPACLTGSFLRKRRTAEMMPVYLDLNKARNIFKELTQKDWITNMITTCLKDNLLKRLPFQSPHQEALEVFFLLPECPVMHLSNNWESLVVPFAKVVCKMSDPSSLVLEEYWATLQESTFSKLVQMFKTAVVCQLDYWDESAEENGNVQALLEMLKKLHRVNQMKCQLPESIFQVDELLYRLNFFVEVCRRCLWKMTVDTSENAGCWVIFSHFPFIFNHLSKIKLLHTDTLLKIEVSFSGEIGYDLVGVKREFFYCLFEEMIQPEYGMFMYPEGASCMWFPVRPKFEKKRYFFFGLLCGLSLFNCNVANLPFPLALFKKLLDQMPSLEDLKELSPDLGKNLQTLLDDEGDNFEEVFYIHFNVHWDRNDTNLIPNGSSIIVNQTNKRDYVSKYIDYIFNDSVKAVYEEFRRGFYKMCDEDIIKLFHPEELKDVIVGHTDYDWKTFEKNARYEPGYNSSHPTIVMFWKAFHKLTLEEKKKFLVFLTGTDRLQTKDLKNMKITFCCPESWNERDPMRALTCFSVLFLPKYSTMETVEEALQVAINNNRGFG